jgi:hypothetical protein
VRHDDDLCDVLDGEVHARACAEAVTRRAKRSDTVGLESRDHRVKDGARARRPMIPILEPPHDVEGFLRIR